MLPVDLTDFGACLRPGRLDDAAALAEVRSDPSTAEYQNWTIPFPVEKAADLFSKQAELTRPTPGRWFTIVIADAVTDRYSGDLAVFLDDDARAAEIGYTLAPALRGRGIATGAAGWLVDWLFTQQRVHRLRATIHPDNVASAMVLERLGFVFEGQTRESFWVGDDVSDDGLYGLLRSDWESWCTRAATAPAEVRLVDVTPANGYEVLALATHKSQERFVATMAQSLTAALVPEHVDGEPVLPWLRAVEADGVLVGFVMLADVTDHHVDPYLWRLLIDRKHQRRGIGHRVLDLVSERCRERGDRQLVTSWVPGRGSPEPLYLRYGFVPTGEIDSDGEVVAALDLSKRDTR